MAWSDKALLVRGVTYTDSLLIRGEFTGDVFSVGRADPHLREGWEFLRHLIQQSPDLKQQQNHSQCKQDHVDSVQVFHGRFNLS